MLKKAIGLFLVIALLMPLAGYAVTNSDTYNVNEILHCTDDEQILFEMYDSILDSNFEDNSVIVVLTLEETRENRQFTARDFRNVGALYVEKLMYLNSNQSGYAQQLWEAEEHIAILEEQVSSNARNSICTQALELALDHVQAMYSDAREQADEAYPMVNFDEFRKIILIRLDQNCKENVLQVIRMLEQRDYVRSASPNYFSEPDTIIPNDTHFASATQWQWALQQINAPAAWNITTGSRAIRVGILGSRVQGNHPELTGRVRDDLGRSWGYLGVPALCFGTQQAGIIAAAGNNGIGMAGIARNVEIVPLGAVVSNGNRYVSGAINAIRHATIVNIPIITHSFQPSYDDGFITAVRNYYGLFINSAGNNGININNHRFGSLAALPNVILVGATDINDRRSVWSSTQSSNFGVNSVELFAPGGGSGIDVLTTAPGSSFGYYNGTSAAAPHVAGAAALVLSASPNLTAAQVRQILIESADVIPGLHGPGLYGRRLNVGQAVERAAMMPIAPTITRHPTHVFGAENESLISYTVNFTGTNVRVRWEESPDDGVTWRLPSRHGWISTEGNSSTLNIVVPYYVHSWKYRAVVYNDLGTEISEWAWISVRPPTGYGIAFFFSHNDRNIQLRRIGQPIGELPTPVMPPGYRFINWICHHTGNVATPNTVLTHAENGFTAQREWVGFAPTN